VSKAAKWPALTTLLTAVVWAAAVGDRQLRQAGSQILTGWCRWRRRCQGRSCRTTLTTNHSHQSVNICKFHNQPSRQADLSNSTVWHMVHIQPTWLPTLHSAHKLGFVFDKHLTFSDQISSFSKSCYSHIRELRRIRPYLDSKTASTIAASIVHSKLDYCNSLYHNLPKSQINRLQQIQNCLACTVVKAPKSSHITPILRSLYWLQINECMEYELSRVLE